MEKNYKEKLIASYKRVASNKELQKELEVWDKIEEEDYEIKKDTRI